MDTPVILLSQKGEVKQAKIKAATIEAFTAVLKKKEAPSVLGRYTWKLKTLILFGFVEGKNGTENQHHLPPPLEGMTFFGDILIVLSNNPNSYTSLIPFKVADYETFYTNKLEGEDEDDEEFEDMDNNAENNDEIDEQDGLDSESDDELNEYGGNESEDDEKENNIVDDEDEKEEEKIPEKVARVSRVRKVAAVPKDEPEIDENSQMESSEGRKKMLQIIKSVLSNYLNDQECLNLETIIFKTSLTTATRNDIQKIWSHKGFQDVYLAVGRRLIGNLNPNSYVKNKNLLERYKQGELTLEQIANQNSYELCPEVWQSLVDAQAKRERIQLEGDFSRATDKWMCNTCKQRKCTYYELQTRSADEPMTIFIHCLNCGKRWTQ
jgi:DNA-directed RNA polymerase subunit M/transcription elongation factor TFIIS